MLCSHTTVGHTEIINQEAEIRNSDLTKPTEEWESLLPAAVQSCETKAGSYAPIRLETSRCLGLFTREAAFLAGSSAAVAERSLRAWPTAGWEVLFPGQTTLPLVVTGSESFVCIWWVSLPLAAQTPGFSVSLAKQHRDCLS